MWGFFVGRGGFVGREGFAFSSLLLYCLVLIFYFAFVLFLSSRIVFFNHFDEFCHCSVYICMDSKDTLIEKSVCDCW